MQNEGKSFLEGLEYKGSDRFALANLMRSPHKNPLVALVERMGTGKTTGVEILQSNLGIKGHYYAPKMIGEIFKEVQFSNSDLIVIDEIGQWDKKSLQAGLASLTIEAVRQGKQLLLIGQTISQLNELQEQGCFYNWSVSIISGFTQLWESSEPSVTLEAPST